MSTNRYSPELRERAVKLVLEHRSEYSSEAEAIRNIAQKIGCHADTLRSWLRQRECDTGQTKAVAKAWLSMHPMASLKVSCEGTPLASGRN